MTNVSLLQPHGHLFSRVWLWEEKRSLKESDPSGQLVFVVFHRVPFREGAWFGALESDELLNWGAPEPSEPAL